jgi:hypothetical protein
MPIARSMARMTCPDVQFNSLTIDADASKRQDRGGMSLRVRMGPFSVSSRGRVGVSAGPVSWSGGGARRSNEPGLVAWLFGAAIVVVLVMWPLSLWGHAIRLTPSWHQLMHRDKAWMHEHYPLVGLRYLVAAIILIAVAIAVLGPIFRRLDERAAERADEQRRFEAEAFQRWLDSPPPPMAFPGRFTQNWLAENVPYLHPGQVPMLMAELRARGWSDARINQRVAPYLPDHV